MADATATAARGFSRRNVLLTGATALGGLAVGVGCTSQFADSPPAHFAKGGQNGAVALNAWVRIEPDDTVTLAIPRAEMGQGVETALPMLIAEELEVDLDRVRVEHPQLDGAYSNYALILEGAGLFHESESHPVRWLMSQFIESLPYVGTGGSTSVMDAWIPLRRAGASARQMLIAAAAEQWGIAPESLIAENGVVKQSGGARQARYGELAGRAARFTPPAKPALKPASRHRLIGKPVARLDLPAKVRGEARFGVDVRGEGMLYAAVRHCPVKGGRIADFDADAIKGMRGVQAVLAVPGGVAVVADNTWRAFQAADALPIEIDDAGHGGVSSAGIDAGLKAQLAQKPSHVFEDIGDLEAGFAAAGKTIEADYAVPYLAHACMEPMNATVKVNPDGSAEVWSPTQSPTVAVWATAEGVGIEKDAVTAHTTYLGGGFGRRAEKDFLVQAAVCAARFPGRPVKLTWSREQDMQNDTYRPMARARMRAGLDNNGRLVAWQSNLASQSVEYEFGERVLPWGGMGGDSAFMNAAGAFRLPYALGNCRIAHHWHEDPPVPVGFWRSVGHSQNAFFTESFVDEVATAAGQDPLAFRLDLLRDRPKHRAVLRAAADLAAADGPAPAGRGRGYALHESFGSIVAQVAEVAVVDGEIKVERVWAAVDCNTVVNPDTVVAQIESGIIYGLSAALYGAITLENGEIQQGNFPDYEMVRLAQAPRIETTLVPSGGHPGGIGEVATPPIAPAVANAVFAATGRRLRDLPLRLDA